MSNNSAVFCRGGESPPFSGTGEICTARAVPRLVSIDFAMSRATVFDCRKKNLKKL